jgi:hypothetical protein
MQLWPTARSLARRYGSPDYEEDDSILESETRRSYYFGANESAILDDDITTVTTEDTTISECTKLKGVYWPGMDIFDSATPEMRRKRNQKKDSSVVEQLELSSQEVEPTEIIFTPQGTFKKQRRISGSVYDDSSPIKAENSPKRNFITRPVLAEMDPNRPRRTRQHAHQATFPNASRSTYGDADPHLDLEYGDFGQQKKKSGFDVFQDPEVSFAHPAGFNYLTSEFHYTQPAQQSPAFSFKPFTNPYQYENKENVDTIYQQPAFYGGSLPFNHFHHPPAGHDHQGMIHNNNANLYFNSYHPHDDDVDDQRTLTAPPSPCPH